MRTNCPPAKNSPSEKETESKLTKSTATTKRFRAADANNNDSNDHHNKNNNKDHNNEKIISGKKPGKDLEYWMLISNYEQTMDIGSDHMKFTS